jgi:uncharacterized cupredoxin-like copper-binding protein
MTRVTRGVVAIVAAIATAIGGYLVVDARDAQATALGPGLVRVDVEIRHSTFSFEELHVRPGTLVSFVVHNRDPIYHELVTGDENVHRRHEQGNESAHPPVPGEVSVAPLDSGATFYQFDTPGRYFVACHLPGHLAYGMKAWVVVEADA